MALLSYVMVFFIVQIFTYWYYFPKKYVSYQKNAFRTKSLYFWKEKVYNDDR